MDEERRSSPTGRAGWLALFAISMGLLEAVVVVYLRELFYPEGFRFPLVPLPPRIVAVELLREITTLLMLLAVALLSARGAVDRFSVFAFLFGVWDIVYYAGLRLFLAWPGSLLTWDVLFLIPLPWIAPVLYPIVISILLISGFVVHELLVARGTPPRPTLRGWITASGGALTVIVAFCWNWRAGSGGRIPDEFPDLLFVAGVVVGTAPFLLAARRAARQNRFRTISIPPT